MEPISVKEILDATGGILLGSEDVLDQTITAVEIDSRAIHDGALFVALRGERTDGHRYINAALENGASGCLLEEEPDVLLPDRFYIQVTNTVEAIGLLAKAYKEKFRIPVIGITGSVGKTTTKDMIASVLGAKYRVLKTEGNFNNELGLPLTLFRLTPEHEICVLEMGMNHFKEILYLTEIVSPDIAVITNIGDAHIENLGSRENILKAKSEIFTYMTEDCMAVLNGDDLMLRSLRGNVSPKTVFCGTREDCEYRADTVRQMGSAGIHFAVRTPTQSFDAEVPALGNHMVYPVLTACAIAEHFGMSKEEICRGIARFVPTKMRMNVVHQGDVTILDDAYNANPQSMKAALEVLSQSEPGFHVAILGDMFELGVLGPALHRSVGEYAAAVGGIDAVLTIGDLTASLHDAARKEIPLCMHAKTKQEAIAYLPELVRSGATILVKASRGMEFEVIVKELQRLSPKN